MGGGLRCSKCCKVVGKIFLICFIYKMISFFFDKYVSSFDSFLFGAMCENNPPQIAICCVLLFPVTNVSLPLWAQCKTPQENFFCGPMNTKYISWWHKVMVQNHHRLLRVKCPIYNLTKHIVKWFMVIGHKVNIFIVCFYKVRSV